MNTIRGFLNPGGFAAALSCLCIIACGNPPGMDSGLTDAGPPPGDTGTDITPDAYVPPDVDGGMPGEDAGTDSGVGDECTPDMMVARVSPPCEPDLPEGTAAATGPSACDTTLDGDPWTEDGTTTGSTSIMRIGPPMNLIEIYIGTFRFSTSTPGMGHFRLGDDGFFYSNWKNAAVPGTAGIHARLEMNASCTGGTVYMFNGGNTTDIPDGVPFDVWLM